MPKIEKGLHLLFRFYKGYIRPFKWRFLTVWFLHVLAAAVFMIPPFMIKQVIDEGIVNKNLHLILVLAGILLGAFAFAAIIDKKKTYRGHLLAQEVTYNLRNNLYSHLQRLSFSFYDNIKIGELISRIIDDLDTTEEIVHHGPENAVQNGSMVLFTGIMVFYLNWQLALACLTIMPAVIILGYIISLKMFKASRQVRKKKALLISRVEDNLSGMRIIQSFARENYEMERFDRENMGHYRSRVSVISPMSWLFPGGILIMAVSLAVTLGYGGYQVIVGTMTVGVLAAFTIYVEQFMWPLLELTMMGESLTRFFAGIERYFKYMDIHPDIKDTPEAVTLEKVRGDIQFRNVWFKYDTETILKDINLHIRPGETVALVGPSGSGKTTMSRLVSRFYEPYEGKILVDEKDIREIKLRSLRANIGVVMQNDYLFSDSLMDNIAYSRLDASKEEIIEAAKQANIHQFIEELPRGYATEIGQRGVKLSEGQAQRVSIARAALKNPPILILDEATSSVDSETELLIQEALERLMRSKTCIVIAHRLSTILGADKILFIENGEIVEEGNHKQLLEKNGRYAHFYNLQFNTVFQKAKAKRTIPQ